MRAKLIVEGYEKTAPMRIDDILTTHDFILMEAAVIEALGRTDAVRLHPQLENALLVYEPLGKEALGALYQEFIDVAQKAEVPLVLSSPTWRASRQRVDAARISQDVNGDGIKFLKRLRDQQADGSCPVLIGGQVGCGNDCYRPFDSLTQDAARAFHGWQIERLAQAGPDFLLAVTLPAVSEAAGMALAMAETGLPYVISFVIDRRGLVLDGSRLTDAIERIDALCPTAPLGYMVNCAYPSFLNAASQPRSLFDRLIGFQANASSLDHADLDGAVTRQADDVPDWGSRMVELNRRYGIKLLGGCCGTRTAHLRYLVDCLSDARAPMNHPDG
jgi:homocysteine S-methyltransferase